MRRLAVLNFAQRIVVVVALAAALRTVWTYLVGLMWTNLVGGSDEGWFGYSPLIEAPGRSGGALGLAFLAIVLIAAWACASVWLLGLPRTEPSERA